ncbi:MAG: hypothetical protein HYX25_03090, partial [Candidatus Solibacter usitatus]|nr:hypothetical protein [Candidatus Solibacter usitatus]
LRTCITTHWNLHLVDNAQNPCPVVPELAELYGMIRATAELYGSAGPVRHLNRQIDQLELRIARLERRLKFIHSNFPNQEKRTQTELNTIVENTELTPNTTTENEQNEPPVYITENKPSVIAAYKREFPNRKIIVLSPDDVAKGIDIEDDMPVAPRKTPERTV